jgi:Leucine-rich repeat (LRR) protein
VLTSFLAIAEEYDCSYTLYRGPLLGETFVGLDSLEYLALGGNAYNSSVPLELAKLPNLKRLYLEESSLTGSLDFVASTDSMLELWLDFNNFDGTIPSTIGTVVTLGSLSLSNNDLSGTIPTEIAKVKRMGKFKSSLTPWQSHVLLTNCVVFPSKEQLWLYNNTLTGQVPSELGNLESMKTLYLDGSRLTGEVPSEVCELKSSGSLDTFVTDCEQEILCGCCTACA